MPETRRQRILTVVYMVAIATFFTAVVAGVHAALRDGIEANRRLGELRGVLEALRIAWDEKASAEEFQEFAGRRLKKDRRDGLDFYRGYGEDGGLIGYAFPIGGAGFWGPVSGYVAIDRDMDRIIGISFVRHAETPGLGARITEDWFKDQFKGKSIAVPSGRKYAIRFVAPGKPKGAQDVDAITGATGTSTAVQLFLNENLAAIGSAMKKGEGRR